MAPPDWFTFSELSNRVLAGAFDASREEGPGKQRRLLDFFAGPSEDDSLSHDTEDDKIPREVEVLDEPDRVSEIRDYTSPSVPVQAKTVEMQRISPFHIREHYPFTLDSDFVERGPGGEYRIRREGVREAVGTLQPRRDELYRLSAVEMLASKSFSYQLENGAISIPFSDYIGDLDDASTGAGSYVGSGFGYSATQLMKSNYADENRMLPDTVLIRGDLAAEVIAEAEVDAKMHPQQPSDNPEEIQTFSQFTFDGLRWIVLHNPVVDEFGNTVQPLPAKTAIVFSSRMPSGRMPFTFHKVENTANAGDTARPYLEPLIESRDTFKGKIKLYDNLVPSIRQKNIAMHWRLKS